MKKIQILLITSFLLITTSVFCQNNSDKIDLELFWKESIEPIIQKDFEKLKTVVEFPLGGEWGFMMGIKKDEKDWTEEDFYSNYNKLFNKKIIKLLEEQSYKDADIFGSEILVGIAWADDDFEQAIILRFRKVGSHWKLFVIQGVG